MKLKEVMAITAAQLLRNFQKQRCNHSNLTTNYADILSAWGKRMVSRQPGKFTLYMATIFPSPVTKRLKKSWIKY